MEALVLERKDELSMRDIRVEEELGPRDVRIALRRVGVCGSTCTTMYMAVSVPSS